MKQVKQKITATAGAILIAWGLVGLNTDQAIAQGKARKGATVRAGSNASIPRTPGSPKQAVPALINGGVLSIATASNSQNAENLRSQAKRKNVAGAEAFSIDIGTSENLILQAERARRKTIKRTRQ